LSPVIRPIQSPHHHTPPHIDNTNGHDAADDYDVDPAVLSTSQQQPIPAIFSYSIIYSQSYSCPVLYIRITDTSGSRAITPEIAMKSILELMTTTADDHHHHHHHNIINAVSYEEHPGMDNCPCIMIHPCKTEEIMDLLLSTNSINDDKNGGSVNRSYKYLVAWLTAVAGNILQLDVPIQVCNMP
jgi:hypothetical protein